MQRFDRQSVAPRSALAFILVALSQKVNYEYLKWFPTKTPYLLVMEFPRSGGNWIRDMLADSLQLPAPMHARLPITYPAILHGHAYRPIPGKAVVYVVRDARDVFLSHLYKTIDSYSIMGPLPRRRIARLHPSVLQFQNGTTPTLEGMVAFYEEWKIRPMGSQVNWARHVESWLDCNGTDRIFVRYEDMIHNPVVELNQLLKKIGIDSPHEKVVDFAVYRNSFKFQTGRGAGNTVRGENKRQGVAGAWRKELPKELQKRFVEDMGNSLHLAGYEH